MHDGQEIFFFAFSPKLVYLQSSFIYYEINSILFIEIIVMQSSNSLKIQKPNQTILYFYFYKDIIMALLDR